MTVDCWSVLERKPPQGYVSILRIVFHMLFCLIFATKPVYDDLLCIKKINSDLRNFAQEVEFSLASNNLGILC